MLIFVKTSNYHAAQNKQTYTSEVNLLISGDNNEDRQTLRFAKGIQAKY